MNIAELLRLRERAIDAVRRFFKAEGFTEVETPTLVASPGVEPHLDPFEVRKTGTDNFLRNNETCPCFLPTSPEYAMKKLLAAGSGSIFQIAKAFRDEPPSAHHLPEFTMLEWYRVGADYRAAMEDCERLCAFVAEAVCGAPSVPWQGARLGLSPPYERLSMREAFHRYAGLKLTFAEPLEKLMGAAQAAGATDIVADDDWDEVFWKLFLRCVEPRIGRERPVFLYDYPARMASLSRIKSGDPDVCERFELYAGGLELANAFSELTDPVEQRRRFEDDNTLRRALGKPELPIDEGLLAALERGLPECAGVALGFDRLLMLLVGASDIRDVVAFALALQKNSCKK